MQLLLFSSGNIMMTGVRNATDADLAVKTIKEFLGEFRPLNSSVGGGPSVGPTGEKPRKAQERTRRRDSDRRAKTTPPAAKAGGNERLTGRLYLKAVRLVEDANPDVNDDEFERLLEEQVEKLRAEKRQKDADTARRKRVREEAIDAERQADQETRTAMMLEDMLLEEQEKEEEEAAPVAAAEATTGGEMDFLLQHLPDLFAGGGGPEGPGQKRKATKGAARKKKKARIQEPEREQRQ